MQSIHLKPDDLDEQARAFRQARLERPLFLNSVPKSGSHLLRNIVRMFVPVEQQYSRDFIQYGNLRDHLAAFDGPPAKLSWGHLFHSDISAISTSAARKVLLVRDPYDWVLSKARFMLSDEFSGDLDMLKNGSISAEDLISMVIFGIPRTLPALKETYTHNAVAWLGPEVHLVRYEELVSAVRNLEAPETKHYFSLLFDACGIAMPADWCERVRIGADPSRSGTAKQNLSGKTTTSLSDQLTEQQCAMVDFASPGLRAILGYS
ncbi:MAG: hypothetical protein ABJ239_08590 [Erythrobacter sp.]